MNEVTFVTTLARDHIDLYGRSFVNSFKQFTRHPLIIFAEDFTSEDIGHDVIDYYSVIPEQLDFKRTIEQSLPGLLTKPQNRLMKALRWSYKSFVIWYALQNIDSKYIVWVDADVIATAPIPGNFANQLCKDKLMMCYPQWIEERMHIESGLIIFNKQHSLINKIISHYEQGYHNKKVLDLNKPWDGFWLGQLIEKDSAISLASELTRLPFSNVKDYLRHNVGKDKFKETGLNKFSGRFS